jgi:periplasmic divalent cation tolerance protein
VEYYRSSCDVKPAVKYALVLVTAPDLKTARVLGRKALKARLVACVNLIPRIESHYWWQEKLTKSQEVLLLLKTRVQFLTQLEALVLVEHPYDTPEFVVFMLDDGNSRYLAWIDENVRG